MSSIQDNRFLFVCLIAFLILILLILYIYYNSIIPQTYLLNKYSSRPVIFTIDNNENTYGRPPYKNPDTPIIPSIPTKGSPNEFQQIGLLTNEKKDVNLPLYGRRLYTSSSKWNYYTSSGSFHSVSIPIKVNNRDCDTELGCDELYSGDKIHIEELNDDFTVKLYNSKQYHYDPRV